MTNVQTVYDFLQEKAPFELQLGFDNAGFLVGRRDAAVSRILVSLDITEPVIQEAVTDQTPTGRKLLALAENHIAAICAHTNLDTVADGVNDALARRLGLSDIAQLKQDGVDGRGRPYGIGRVGRVEEQPLKDFARFVKKELGANGVRLVDGGRPVRKVAVGGGSCSDMMGDALALGCDTFVTADVKYDGFLDAKALGLNLIDAGHFPTENVVCPVLRDWLDSQFSDVEVAISRVHHEVFSYL